MNYYQIINPLELRIETIATALLTADKEGIIFLSLDIDRIEKQLNQN